MEPPECGQCSDWALSLLKKRALIRPVDESSKILEALRGVMDPELGINVVDLGLVSDIRASGQAVEVDLGMTSPTCPLGPLMKSDAEKAVRDVLPQGTAVTVHLIADLQWEPTRMSADAKAKLGWK